MLEAAAPTWSLVQATSQRRWLWLAFQLARSEITFVFFLEWSGRASLPFLFSEHRIPPLAMLHGSPELRYVMKAVCSMNCLWERKSSNPKSCLSACQLSPSLQALGDPINISDLEVGPLQLHQDRRGGSLPWTLDLQLRNFSCAGSGWWRWMPGCSAWVTLFSLSWLLGVPWRVASISPSRPFSAGEMCQVGEETSCSCSLLSDAVEVALACAKKTIRSCLGAEVLAGPL